MSLTFEQAGLEKKVQVGDAMEMDMDDPKYYFCEKLQPCDDWDQADFRVPMGAGLYQVAVSVEITGRRVHFLQSNNRRARAKFHFVGDGDDGSYAKGWVYFHSQKN